MFHIENSQLSKFFVINLTLKELKFYRSFLGLRFTAKNLERFMNFLQYKKILYIDTSV